MHGVINSTAWFLLGNLAVWSLHFKAYRYAMLIHIFCMSCAAMLFTIGPIIMIVYYGDSVILQQWYHQLLGFIFYCIMPLLLISGAVCKISKTEPQTSPDKVYARNKAHGVFGWIFLTFTQIVALTGWWGGNLATNIVFGVILLGDTISYSLYFYLKFRGEKMGNISLNVKFT